MTKQSFTVLIEKDEDGFLLAPSRRRKVVIPMERRLTNSWRI